MNHRNNFRVLIGVVVVAIALAPLVLGNFTVSLMNDIGIGALVALGLVLLTGVGGATSFGQAAFVGIAAYATAWLTTTQGLSPWLGLLFALLLTGLSALAIGMLTLRLGGHFLPLSTIAWGLSIAMLFGNVDALGRHTGLSNIPPLCIAGWSLADPRAIYYLIWFIVGLACPVSATTCWPRGPGRAIRSLRGGATLRASVGADASRVRLSLCVLAALLAGLAGWSYAHMNRFVEPCATSTCARASSTLAHGGLRRPRPARGRAGGLCACARAEERLAGRAAAADPAGRPARGGHLRRDLHPAGALRAGRPDGLPAQADAGRFAAPRSDEKLSVPVVPLPHRTLPARGSRILSVNGAVKRFGGLVAVNDVSFDVDAGEIIGLYRPQRRRQVDHVPTWLTCTLPMTSGQVRFLDRDIAGMAQREVARLGLARTFQHVKLRPHMSLLDNVALGAHSRTRAGVLKAGLRLDRTEERQILQEARRQLERIGLGDRAHELAGSLPLGTQRILEIARALAADPVLLVLDEPAAGLRRKEKMALGDLLRKLREEGVTILIVEHDMDFVMKLVDRLVVMNFGSKLLEGVPAAVRADERVQAAYLGSVA